jgi:hypothetical protein
MSVLPPLLPNVLAKKGSLFFSISWIRVVGLKKFAGVGGCQKIRGACGAHD